MVVVRTVTASLAVHDGDASAAATAANAKRVGELLVAARGALVAPGGGAEQVQTLRASTGPVLDEWLAEGMEHATAQGNALVAALQSAGVELVSAGPVFDAANFRSLANLLVAVPALSASASLNGDEHGAATDLTESRLRWHAALEAAEAVRTLSRAEPDGGGNFRLCVTANVKSGTPFFPASYFEAAAPANRPSFAIGLETSDLLIQAFEEACQEASEDLDSVLRLCEAKLVAAYAQVMRPLHETCMRLAADFGAEFTGIDASMNPSLAGKGIGHGFKVVLEKLAGTPSMFGQTGTLALSYLVTRSIRRAGAEARVTLTGYSGLMLPQLEDLGLAQAASEGAFAVKDLLLYSAVCGVGIDTVPLPGDVPTAKLAMLLLDMQALSERWNKPLACRVLPVPGAVAGDRTKFANPYLCDSVVLGLP